MGVIRSDSGLSPTQQPNYVNPPTRKPSVQAVGILFGVLVTLSLVLRLYSRGYIKRQFDLDDIFATFATLFTDATFVMQMVVTIAFHRDRHIWDIPPSDKHQLYKIDFVYNIIFAQGACQSKLSLLFFSRKMIGAAKSGAFYPHYVCLLALITIVALCQVLFVIVSCVECHPLKAAWEPNPTYHHKCFNTEIFLFITGVINTLTDFLCTLLPAFIVFKLHMPLYRRIGVASLFLVGVVVNIASALRIYFLYYDTETGDTWDLVPSAICSDLELGLGLLCVNLPIIRPLITLYTRHAMTYIRLHGSKNKYYSNDSTTYHLDGYEHSRHSDMYAVGEDSRATAFVKYDGPSGRAPRIMTRTSMDENDALRTVESNAVVTSGPRKVFRKTNQTKMPSQ